MARPRPKDDRELEEVTGIRPADHQYTSTAVINQMERKLLGRDWFKPRPIKESE